MPLTLVTGPANAEKAGRVLGGFREALGRGEAPILVVPTFADVERYQRELTNSAPPTTPAVFGAEVMTFDRLMGEVARRAGVRGRVLSGLARERAAVAAISSARLGVLERSARTRGFPRALLRFVDELGQARITPQRLTQALRAWAGEDAARRAYADDVAGLFSAYRRTLERLERTDRPSQQAAALDALSAEPLRWGSEPVFLYGFDDLEPLQRDAVQVLAMTPAQVTLSLAYEAGRMAFSGRATTFAELHTVGVEHIALEARAEHYAEAARAALHHLERRLFEPVEGQLFDPAPVDAGAAVTLLRGGGERAEMELVAAEAARLIAGGVAPDEIAVVLRDPVAHAPLVAQVFSELGVPAAVEQRVALGHTPLGRGFVALLRCALLEATAGDLLTYLRTPGVLQRLALADGLEATVRRRGARTATEARSLWEAEHWHLGALDRLRAGRRAGAEALLEAATAELETLFAAPRKREAAVLCGIEEQDARVLAAARAALSQLRAITAEPALMPGPEELVELLADLEVRLGDRLRGGAVAVTDPQAIRARRVRALFACRLQEGAFPAPARPEPFLGDAERTEIAAASGLILGRSEDELGAERYLFYATVTRPEERLYLSWHEAGDDGAPAVRSFFVSDVGDLFAGGLEDRVRSRALGEVVWPAGLPAPTVGAAARAEAAAGPRHHEPVLAPLADPALLELLREREAWSASAVESWAGCPVKWFVERVLNPEGLEPDPEAMLRGAVAHTALERTLRTLGERTSSARVEPATLPQAQAILTEVLDELLPRPDLAMSSDPRRQRAMERRARSDLARYLDHAAVSGTAFTPDSFEVTFGEGRAGSIETGPLELPEDVRLRGRIDRIDRSGGEAIVYDYKGRNTKAPSAWRKERRYQVALYLLVARDVLGLDAVGGFYQPLGGKEPRPRGVLRAGADPGLDTFRNDRMDPDALTAVVDGVVEDVLEAVAQMREGALEARPATCAFEGGCAYPSICRCEG